MAKLLLDFDGPNWLTQAAEQKEAAARAAQVARIKAKSQANWRAEREVKKLRGDHLAPRSAAKRETYIHAVADKHLKSFTTAVRYAFMRGRKAVKGVPPKLTPDIAAGAVREALVNVLPDTIEPLVRQAGEATMAHLPKIRLPTRRRSAAEGDPELSLPIRFDAVDPHTVEWIKRHALELAEGLSDTTREAIRQALIEAAEGDLDVDDLRDLIEGAVGDDTRAETIARTEIMTAANEGQREGWRQAADAGLLDDSQQRVWIATPIGACPDCDDLDGTRTDLDGTYEYQGDDIDGPPAHPNCRCTEGIVDAE